MDQIVGEDDAEGLVAHDGPGAEHGVAKTQGSGLADVDEVHIHRRDGVNDVQKLLLALGSKLGLKLGILVEMILDGALVAARDEDHVGDAGRSSFFHGVLDERLVDNGEHFLGHCLGGGQKSGPEAGHGEYGFANWFDHA